MNTNRIVARSLGIILAVIAFSLIAPKACEGQTRNGFQVLAMVGGPAREQMRKDWNDTDADSATPERLYEVTKDSIGSWLSGQDTILVLYVLEVKRLHGTADAMHFHPDSDAIASKLPTIHTHQGYCSQTQWGMDTLTCSHTAPESSQCRGSIQDMRSWQAEEHNYDAVQCGPQQYVFYFQGHP